MLFVIIIGITIIFTIIFFKTVTIIKYIVTTFQFLIYTYILAISWFQIWFPFCYSFLPILFAIIFFLLLFFKPCPVPFFFPIAFRLSKLTATGIVYPYLSTPIGKPFLVNKVLFFFLPIMT